MALRGKPLLDCLVGLFLDPRETLSNPRGWDPLSAYLFLMGIERAEIHDAAFTSISSCFVTRNRKGRRPA